MVIHWDNHICKGSCMILSLYRLSESQPVFLCNLGQYSVSPDFCIFLCTICNLINSFHIFTNQYLLLLWAVGSYGIMWDHVGSCGSYHVGLSGVMWDHVGSYGIMKTSYNLERYMYIYIYIWTYTYT